MLRLKQMIGAVAGRHAVQRKGRLNQQDGRGSAAAAAFAFRLRAAAKSKEYPKASALPVIPWTLPTPSFL